MTGLFADWQVGNGVLGHRWNIHEGNARSKRQSSRGTLLARRELAGSPQGASTCRYRVPLLTPSSIGDSPLRVLLCFVTA